MIINLCKKFYINFQNHEEIIMNICFSTLVTRTHYVWKDLTHTIIGRSISEIKKS
jgi:hypothetical protein